MVRVLFVCHGNICRSPMAEFILKDMAEKRGMSQYFDIASAATTLDDQGKPVHKGTQRRLAQEGISCDGKTARRIKKEDYDNYDFIIGMDRLNMLSLRRFFKNDPDHKIYKLMEFADSNDDVADPWFTRNFDQTYDDIYKGCNALFESLVGSTDE